jgi:hypothetical protein
MKAKVGDAIAAAAQAATAAARKKAEEAEASAARAAEAAQALAAQMRPSVDALNGMMDSVSAAADHSASAAGNVGSSMAKVQGQMLASSPAGAAAIKQVQRVINARPAPLNGDAPRKKVGLTPAELAQAAAEAEKVRIHDEAVAKIITQRRAVENNMLKSLKDGTAADSAAFAQVKATKGTALASRAIELANQLTKAAEQGKLDAQAMSDMKEAAQAAVVAASAVKESASGAAIASFKSMADDEITSGIQARISSPGFSSCDKAVKEMLAMQRAQLTAIYTGIRDMRQPFDDAISSAKSNTGIILNAVSTATQKAATLRASIMAAAKETADLEAELQRQNDMIDLMERQAGLADEIVMTRLQKSVSNDPNVVSKRISEGKAELTKICAKFLPK